MKRAKKIFFGKSKRPKEKDNPENGALTQPGEYFVPQDVLSAIESVVAKFAFRPQHNDELALIKGDRVKVLEKEQDGWWKGRIGSREGWFPSNYIMTEEEYTKAAKSAVEKPVIHKVRTLYKYTNAAKYAVEKPVIHKVRTLYKFDSTFPEDLKFERGEILEIVEKPDYDPNWWVARKEDGSSGLVPRNYIVIVGNKGEFPASSPAPHSQVATQPPRKVWGNNTWGYPEKPLNETAADRDFLVRVSKTLEEQYQEDVDGLFTGLEKPKPEPKPKGGKFSEKAVPLEINLRGPLALEAYNKALSEGKACVKRVPVMLIGQDRSGKTSLKKSLMGKPFNPDEDSTVGIDVDPSHFKVSTEIWRPGENDQATHSADSISYEHHAARLVAKHLKEEKPVGVRGLKSVQSRDIPLVDTKLDDGKHVPNASSDDRSDPTQWREEHSPLALPEIPDEVATLIKKIIKEVENVQDEDEIYSILWDFGGQSVYYATHPLFITAKAMYLLVYDLSRGLNERAKPEVKQGMFNKIVDNYSVKTNLDYLNFWMTSIASLASQDQDQQLRSGPKSEVPRVNIPPVFLVCTHADKPCDSADPFALAHKVFDSLQTKSYKTQLYEDVFVVDNTKSGTESECSEVIRLRENVRAVAMELPQTRESIPIKWLRYENALRVAAKEGRKWISLEMAKQIAYEVCKIEDNQEFLTLLDFLHDQRILIHFDDTPMLNNMVVLDPQWLVDVFKKVITVKPYQQEEKEFKDLWYRLESTGILDEKLLEHVWGPLLEQQETSASLIEIMEKFSLLCPWPSSDASCGKQYLVPSMLTSHPPQDIIELVASAQIPSFFLKFESGQVPPGLFSRLVLQFFQWGRSEFWSSENPQLYHNFARFYTSEDEDCSVILLCHSSSIEVVVHRGNLGADLTERFQSKLNILADINYDAFEVACARAARRKLGLMLECMREEFCWLKNMKYEEGFICSVCCQGCVLKYCSTHHKQNCEQEDCLHFWSESDLRSAKLFVRCRRCATAKNDKVQVKQFAPWIRETSDEQRTIDESDGRLLVPEGGNDEKLLALPTKALESLLSQPCDSSEVVLQLKDRLQLDSLEHSDPGTKRLIRCLAIKAKELERLDVVKHLRELTPAGTTGPLLPERLDIRNIPVRQMTKLTVELSGGEDWKLVAEDLGLTPQEIRFLDKRTLNPCEAVLAFISKRQYVSVGTLYDKLNKCGLPVTADIL